MSPPERRLTVGEAALLGVLHGPAELLPISSSAHVTLIPWLMGWDYAELDHELRKTFEVALHAGTALALASDLRNEVLDRDALWFAALTVAPPALVGYALERAIERRVGTPASIALGLLVGAATMVAADRQPQRRGRARAGDALWLGVTQALALVPGVSRAGATLSAARMRGLTRVEATRVSRWAALPVLAGACALKGFRLARRGLPPGTGRPFVVGAAASLASTLGATRLVREPDGPLWPYALYRSVLAAVVLARLRSAASTTMSP